MKELFICFKKQPTLHYTTNFRKKGDTLTQPRYTKAMQPFEG